MSTSKTAEWRQKLTHARTEFINLLNSLTEAQLQTPIISEGNTWNVLDIVAHLLENERGMSIHVHKIRQGKETVPQDFDLEAWNAGLKERAEEKPLNELLEALAHTRAKTLDVLESLEDNEWALQGRHASRGTITIEQFYETMVNHDNGHANDIKKALQLN